MYNFTKEELYRYSRHILLKDIGIEGQEKIRQGKVLIIGMGGLGSPVAMYLAAAGVGTIGIADGDVVDISNLQRQIIHFSTDVGKLKIESAKEKISLINPNIKVNLHNLFLNSQNIAGVIEDYDFIVDGTDNFPIKFLINDACVMNNKPYSHGGILRFEGQTFTHLPCTACYRCLFSYPLPSTATRSCAEEGVLGAIAGIIGTIQATEVLKYLTSTGSLLTNQLLTFNAKTMDFKKVAVYRHESCPICGCDPSINTLIDYNQLSCELSTKKNYQ